MDWVCCFVHFIVGGWVSSGLSGRNQVEIQPKTYRNDGINKQMGNDILWDLCDMVRRGTLNNKIRNKP
jgi:hypothetical protein